MLQKANTNVIGTKTPPMNLWFFVGNIFFQRQTAIWSLSESLYGYF